jgi:hypothetical protein
MAVHFKGLGVEIQPSIARDKNGFIPQEGDRPETFEFHEGWFPEDEEEWLEYIAECEEWINRQLNRIKAFHKRDEKFLT